MDKNKRHPAKDKAGKETVGHDLGDIGFYSCWNGLCCFKGVALSGRAFDKDGKPTTCPMCHTPLHAEFDKLNPEKIKNGLLWLCNSCGHITPRHPNTKEKDVGACSHCGGRVRESNLFELILKHPDRMDPSIGSTGGE